MTPKKKLEWGSDSSDQHHVHSIEDDSNTIEEESEEDEFFDAQDNMMACTIL